MTNSTQDRVLIIGAGQAGAQCAASLRRFGHQGEIILAGEENHPPYQRPPLSKAYLLGEEEAEHLWLQAPDSWRNEKVELRTGVRAERIDREARIVHFEDGDALEYGQLVIAAGSRVRPLPVEGADREGVRYLRTIDDVDQLKDDFAPGKRIAVIGGGYIGLEAAAAAKKRGAEPVVVEMMDRLLARVAAHALSDFYLAAHERRGVEVRLDTLVEKIGSPLLGKGLFVQVEGGEKIPCDSILVGIGVIPNVELAEEAGLDCPNGIAVDAQCRTADPSIFAIGDCAYQRHWLYGQDLRLESVPNAIEQAKHAAAAITGAPAPKPEPPWFWSDQFDLKLQSAGLVFGGEESLVRGSPDAEAFALFHFTDGRLTAADAINDPPSFMAAKMMIAQGKTPDRDALVDPDTPMKDVMKAALAGG